MNNIAFYIFTTFKNHDRCKLIEQTWGKDQDLYFFTDKIIEEDNYIACTYDSNYISHIYKNFYAIDYAYNKHKNKYDWFVFIGDDTFFYTKSLHNNLNKLNLKDNKVYGEIANCWDRDRSLFYALGGGGIIFNKVSLSTFCQNRYDPKIFSGIGYSDVAIGMICKQLNIELEPLNGIYSQNPTFYNISNPQNYISFHYIKTKEDFWKLNSYV